VKTYLTSNILNPSIEVIISQFEKNSLIISGYCVAGTLGKIASRDEKNKSFILFYKLFRLTTRNTKLK